MEESTDTKNDNRPYEFATLIAPSVAENEARNYFEAIIKKLLRSGGIAKEKNLQRIRLAYPIKKQQGAYFGYCVFEATPETILAVNNELLLDKNILRFIVFSKKLNKNARRAKIQKPRPERTISTQRPERLDTKSEVDNEALERTLEEILQ